MKPLSFAMCVALALCACSPKKESTASGADSSANVKEQASVAADTASAGFLVAGEFHKMLAHSNGTWKGKGTLWFAPGGPPVDGGTTMLINTMAMNDLYQISEIKGRPAAGKPWTGLRITSYDSERKLFARAMIGEGRRE